MDGASLVWDHFKFNAEQRIKAFNFFVLLSIFADGGVFTAIERELAASLVGLLGLFIVLLSLVFWMIDTRSRDLILLTIPAIKEIEAGFPESYRLFNLDAAKQGRFIRYTVAFRILLLSQCAFGIGIALFGLFATLRSGGIE